MARSNPFLVNVAPTHGGSDESNPTFKPHCYWSLCWRYGGIKGTREPLNNSARSAFLPQKPHLVWCDPSDSSRSYGRGAQRARCGFCGETLTGRASAGSPPRLGSLIWNDQTTLAQAKPEPPAEAPSRPCRVIQRFPSSAITKGFSGPCFYSEPHERRYDRRSACQVVE